MPAPLRFRLGPCLAAVALLPTLAMAPPATEHAHAFGLLAHHHDADGTIHVDDPAQGEHCEAHALAARPFDPVAHRHLRLFGWEILLPSPTDADESEDTAAPPLAATLVRLVNADLGPMQSSATAHAGPSATAALAGPALGIACPALNRWPPPAAATFSAVGSHRCCVLRI